MSMAAFAPVLANRGGYEASGDTLTAVLLLGAFTIAFAVIVVYLRRRREPPAPVTDQWQALTVMGELCPHGWQAQVTLYGWGAPVPEDAPPARTPLVALEWKEYADDDGHVAVQRRVWARTIEDALQKMVDDRRLDVRLEQIEFQAPDEDG